jgi:hypothetical protein
MGTSNYSMNLIGYGKGGYLSIKHVKFRKASHKYQWEKNFTTADLKSSYRNMAYFAVIFCSFIFMQVKA